MHTSGTQVSRLSTFPAILFDLDGVLTPTVDVHVAAWTRLFAPYLAEHGIEPAYSPADYYKFIDGRPRVDGVRNMLAARGLTLPEGTSNDSPGTETVWGLGNRKNAEFAAVLEDEGVAPYPGSLAYLNAEIAGGRRVAVVTSSRNAERVLQVSGLDDVFEVVVDGLVAAANRLPGKPAPDTYVFGAKQLGLTPQDCVVVEDAESGVQSAKAGGFGFIIGVDRGTGAEGLLKCGADVVVDDLAELVPYAAHFTTHTTPRSTHTTHSPQSTHTPHTTHSR